VKGQPNTPTVSNVIGTIHLRHQYFLGGEGSNIGQLCRRIVVKKLPTEGSRGQKICRRLKWMVPKILDPPLVYTLHFDNCSMIDIVILIVCSIGQVLRFTQSFYDSETQDKMF
jgi:hypothetical protein